MTELGESMHRLCKVEKDGCSGEGGGGHSFGREKGGHVGSVLTTADIGSGGMLGDRAEG